MNCLGCPSTNTSTCLKCKYGYYLNNDLQCVKCSSSCTGCVSDDACFSCTQGYYLAKTDDSVTGKCLICIDQCKTCSQFGYLCTSCNTGYVLDGSKCIA